MWELAGNAWLMGLAMQSQAVCQNVPNGSHCLWQLHSGEQGCSLQASSCERHRDAAVARPMPKAPSFLGLLADKGACDKRGLTFPCLASLGCHLQEAALRVSLHLSIDHLTQPLHLAPKGTPLDPWCLDQISIASNPNYYHSNSVTQRKIIIPLTKVRYSIWNAACHCKPSPTDWTVEHLVGFFPVEPVASQDIEESGPGGIWWRVESLGALCFRSGVWCSKQEVQYLLLKEHFTKNAGTQTLPPSLRKKMLEHKSAQQLHSRDA